MGLVWKYRDGKNWYLAYNRSLGLRRKSIKTSNTQIAEMIRAKEENDLLLAQAGIQLKPLHRIRLSQFIENFINFKIGQGVSQSTIKSYTYALNNLGIFLGIDEHLHKLTRKKFEEYVAHRYRQKRSNKTIRNELINFISALRWAKREGYILTDPLDGFQLPKKIKKLPEYLHYDEYLKIRKSLFQDKRFASIIDFYILTGCRREEGINIRIDRDIDLKARMLYIRQSKTNDFRRLPISDELLPVIRRLIKFGKIVNGIIVYKTQFGNKIKLYTNNGLSRRFARLIKRLKLRPELHFHSLRHTFGTWLAMSGAPQRNIQQAMGHSDPSSTKIYVHSMDDAFRRDIEKLRLPIKNKK